MTHVTKAAYAALLIQTPDDPFAAAVILCPDDMGEASRIALQWAKDPEVEAEMRELYRNGKAESTLPGKAELSREVWSRMKRAEDDEDFVKLAKLYAEIHGMVEKPGTNNNIAIVVPKVLNIPQYGNVSDWEADSQAQQKELLGVARSRH